MGLHGERVPNALLHHLVVLVGLVLCAGSGHELLILGPKVGDSNASVEFSHVNREEGTVVRDVEQGNLLLVVCIVPALISCLLMQPLEKGA